MRRTIAAIGLVAAVVFSTHAQALRCPFPPLVEQFKAADHVFLAEIQEVEIQNSDDRDYLVVTKFVALETFKGSPPELTSIRSRGGNLSYPLTSGKRAIVFIRKGMAEPCGGTMRYEAKRDRDLIKELRHLRQEYLKQ
jgi:hypothetical protein